MTLKLRDWDSASHLQTKEDIAAYLDACLEHAGDDATFLAKALGIVARAPGMTKLVSDAGPDREDLYAALAGDANPGVDTILRLLRALRLQLRVEPIAE